MPVMETYTRVQELPAPAAPAPRRSRVSTSSRVDRRQARSTSSKRQHPRHSSDESGTSSSSSSSSHRAGGQSKLTDLFIDTKIEMMRMVETDLKLKLDVREMKQCFYNLLQNFEAFEQQQIEQPEVVSTLRRQTHLKHPGTHRAMQRRVSRASFATLEDPSSSARCPNNTQASSAAGWTKDTASLMVGNYTGSRFAGDETALSEAMGASRVENMSAITQCSNLTYREQSSQSRLMDAGGPLSSTIRYPQYSTPEKKRSRACPVSPITSRVEDLPTIITTIPSPYTQKVIRDGHRRRLVYNRPADADAPAAPRPAAPRPAAALVHRSAGSDSDATPIAVRAVTRLPGQHGDGYDSGMYGSDTPSTLCRPANSRRQNDFRSVHGDDVSLEVVSPLPHHRFMESMKVQDSRLRRQTAQPCLSDEPRSPVGLSETDLLESSSFFGNTIFQCSNNATRASIANMSAFSTSPLSPRSEVASSTGTESSYKESDATASSPPLVSNTRNYSRKQQDVRYHSRQMSTVSRYTSGTSTSSCAGGGFLAPSNSPNATSDSAASSNLPREPSSSSSAREQRASHIKKNVVLGARPPCIGSDVMLMAARPPPIPRAASDPETSRASLYAEARAARRETQDSGASSGASTCSSDQSGASSNNTSKETTVGCIGVSLTPKKAGGVRRSLSKRIKKLGKKMMKNNARAKNEAQHSI